MTKLISFRSRSPQSHEDTKFVNFPGYTMRCYLIIDEINCQEFVSFGSFGIIRKTYLLKQ